MNATLPPDHPLNRLGITGGDLYQATFPATWAEEDTGYAWARFLGAVSLLLDPVADVARGFDGHERWTQLASPERCPPEWLPVLAQWAGVRRADAMTERQLRDLIGPHAPGMWRGTKAAMLAAVRRFLPPSMQDQIYFEERADGNAYLLRIFTYTFATRVPGNTWADLRDLTWQDVGAQYADWMAVQAVTDYDASAVWRALAQAKPAGLILEYEIRPGQQWSALRDRGLSWADVRDLYADWAAVHSDLQEEA